MRNNSKLQKAYGEYVNKLQTDKKIAKWTPEQRLECRKQFLKENINNPDVQAYIKSKAPKEEAKPTTPAAEATPQPKAPAVAAATTAETKPAEEKPAAPAAPTG